MNNRENYINKLKQEIGRSRRLIYGEQYHFVAHKDKRFLFLQKEQIIKNTHLLEYLEQK